MQDDLQASYEQFQQSVSALKTRTVTKKRDGFNAAAVFVPLPFFLFHLFSAWYDLNASVCILCLSAGRPERGGLPEDGMCQPHSGHQELLQGTVDKNGLKVSKLENEEVKTTRLAAVS